MLTRSWKFPICEERKKNAGVKLLNGSYIDGPGDYFDCYADVDSDECDYLRRQYERTVHHVKREHYLGRHMWKPIFDEVMIATLLPPECCMDITFMATLACNGKSDEERDVRFPMFVRSPFPLPTHLLPRYLQPWFVERQRNTKNKKNRMMSKTADK